MWSCQLLPKHWLHSLKLDGLLLCWHCFSACSKQILASICGLEKNLVSDDIEKDWNLSLRQSSVTKLDVDIFFQVERRNQLWEVYRLRACTQAFPVKWFSEMAHWTNLPEEICNYCFACESVRREWESLHVHALFVCLCLCEIEVVRKRLHIFWYNGNIFVN